ncbi:hypothetical protein [Acinetobacter calcoaceticus]|uniref:hypothetical protein n=1 Tax=Acinetobacter calcoaceticus TaxID=471 RepID=UPI001E5DC42A|nr:hypothetical protein [Acinetobacter calcoaceticus]UGQ30346.1 hypothetical protein LRO84_02535 [Acinetobacter calcoaceticus]
MDLRLELKKAETQLILPVNDLPELLTKAKRSREAISSAIGQLRSRGLKKVDSRMGGRPYLSKTNDINSS